MSWLKGACASGALLVAAALAFLSFDQTRDVTANMLILIAQFLMYSLTLFGFGELVMQLYKHRK